MVVSILFFLFFLVIVVLEGILGSDDVKSLTVGILALIGAILSMFSAISFYKSREIQEYHIKYVTTEEKGCPVRVDSMLVIDGKEYKFEK